MKPSSLPSESRWPHRWAVLLAVATFPLIWVGGLVTTHDAGMAVPDWPSTYGYNLFLYPWQTWLAGPFDLFIEHGHRLLGALVGLIAIALLVSVWRADARPALKYLSAVALALVIFQGLLGGLRVLADDRTVAMLHGCVGPAFFAFAACLVIITSRRWRTIDPIKSPAGAGLHRLCFITAGLAYFQLILGAQVRHIADTASAGSYRTLLIFHLLAAFVLLLHAFAVFAVSLRKGIRLKALVAPAALLAVLIVGQLFLGVATYIVKFNWPTWLPISESFATYTVTAGGWEQSLTVTAHVAMGSLILATAASLALLSTKLVASTQPAATRSKPGRTETFYLLALQGGAA